MCAGSGCGNRRASTGARLGGRTGQCVLRIHPGTTAGRLATGRHAVGICGTIAGGLATGARGMSCLRVFAGNSPVRLRIFAGTPWVRALIALG